LWPERRGEYCHLHRDSEHVQGRVEGSDDTWAGLFSDTQAFIDYEYRKHGSCMDWNRIDTDRVNKDIRDIVDRCRDGGKGCYTDITVQLARGIDLGRVLIDSGIVPSDNTMYSTMDVHRIITAALGVRSIQMICKRVKTSTLPRASSPHPYRYTSLLLEVRICLDGSLHPMDCPQNRVKCYPSLRIPENKGNSDIDI